MTVSDSEPKGRDQTEKYIQFKYVKIKYVRKIRKAFNKFNE